MEAIKQRTIDEGEIRQILEKRAEAIRTMNLETLMPVYAPDLVSFDIVPPIQYLGREAKKKPWIDVFEMYRPPINYEVRNLSITVGDNVAFIHCFNRISGTLKNGQYMPGSWVRWTACFRKIGSNWLIAHEAVSVPVDFSSGKALLDLEP